jgi:hypothetical protein
VVHTLASAVPIAANESQAKRTLHELRENDAHLRE